MEAQVIRSVVEDTVTIVTVICPYCHGKHSHGVSGTTWRSAHCGKGEYQIQVYQSTGTR